MSWRKAETLYMNSGKRKKRITFKNKIAFDLKTINIGGFGGFSNIMASDFKDLFQNYKKDMERFMIT